MTASAIPRLLDPAAGAIPAAPGPSMLLALLQAAAWAAVRVALRLYCRFEVVGAENLPRSGPFVLVANHASHLDAVALRSALPRRLGARAYSLAARDYFFASAPVAAAARVFANAVPIDRSAPGAHAVSGFGPLLAAGAILVMFPEGTRSIDGRVGPFRTGVGLLVAGTDVPVVPCYLDGARRAWPKGARLPRPLRVRLIVGPPRTYSDVPGTRAGAAAVCDDLRTAVVALGAPPAPTTPHPQEGPHGDSHCVHGPGAGRAA